MASNQFTPASQKLPQLPLIVLCGILAAIPILPITALAGSNAVQTAATAPGCTADTVPAGRVYSVDELAARLVRPAQAAELLHNLKVALDESLLLQPKFYDEQNLQKFFGGARVSRGKWGSSGLATQIEQVMTLTGTGAFRDMTATLKRTCRSIVQSGVTQRTRLAGSARIDVAALSGFSVELVRASLGKENHA